MSTFTVIALGVVSYFVLGGFMLGLISADSISNDDILYWPGLFVVWLRDVMFDLGVAIRERFIEWRMRNNERET